MKILIIRLSSIGDIIQCMGVTGGFKNHHPKAEIHWIVRKDLAQLLKIDPRIDTLWEFDRKEGLVGIIKLAFKLRKLGYTHIYDAHSNIRSNIIKMILKPLGIGKSKLITRHKHRFKRFLLFKFGINKLPNPFRATESFRAPVRKWGLSNFNTDVNNWKFNDEIVSKCTALCSSTPEFEKTVTLVPSAAHDLKKWGTHNWQALIKMLPDYNFVILAGPNDTFCNDITSIAPDRINNLAGKTSLLESFYICSQSRYVISGDTGFLHAADLFNRYGIAIIGPSAFGYPLKENNFKVFEIQLPCKPCSKDGSTKCKIKETKKCLESITPKSIASEVDKHFSNL